MWKKPEVQEAKFFEDDMVTELSEKEMEEVSGKGAGVCVVVGFACWEKGGFGIGVCYVVGTLN